MKFIYMTDSHFKGTGPESRSDNYFEAGLRKFQWVIDYAYEHKIKTILHGGDVHDHARPGYGTVNSIAKKMSEADGIQFLLNGGNHDLFGWNPETYPRTALQTLDLLPNVTVLPDDQVYFIKSNDSLPVAIHAIWSKFDREGDATIFRFPREFPGIEDFYCITMAHTMLVERSFFGAYVAMDDIEWGQSADLILGSHYHPGWPITLKNTSAGRRILAHPGSFMRIMKAAEQRIPKILVIDIGIKHDDTMVTEIVVEVAEPWPFKEDADIIPEEEVLYGPVFENFLEQLLSSSVDASAFDPRTMAKAIAREHGFADSTLKRVITNLDSVSKEGENE